MTSATDVITVERELVIDATPETVWELLVDPEKTGRIARGEYVELDPPRRLVFTWGWEGENPVAPGSTRVEFSLGAEGGGTRLHFVHSGLPTADAAGSHGYGWDHYLARLAIAAPGGDAGPDPWLGGDRS